MRLSSGQKGFIGGSAKCKVVLRGAQSTNEAIGVNTIYTKGGGCIR